MTISEFVSKWRKVELKERSAAQEHFLDLCRVFEHPTPAAADPTGEAFCFEKGAAKHGGGDGFADVWKRGFFGWEYKGKHKDLDTAYDQLLRYRDALESPPLLVLCDLDRIIVRTNFTGTVSAIHEIPLESLGEPRSVEVMRAVFHNPEALRPGRTSTAITKDAARRVAEIADAMRKRDLDPAAVAHFMDRVIFCLFAEDAGLLPAKMFTRILDAAKGDPDRFSRFLGQLFEAMANGGEFGVETVRHFNGNLFDDPSVLPLTAGEVASIAAAARLDWSAVDPSIFGTLFERGLDPAKRSQLGAHFTSREDIELIVDAVVMSALRRDWKETRAILECLLTTGRKSPLKSAKSPPKAPSAAVLKKARSEAGSILHRFLIDLQRVKILDPACGSGNFLYVALHRLKDLEKEVILFGDSNGLGSFLPACGPWQLYGIEINPYAHDLAQMTVWIGWLQWIRANGFGTPADPILRPLADNIRLMDAILGPDGQEPEWPAVDFIIGNPPFLGDKLMRRELGDNYVDQLRGLYAGRLPGQSDLCCYWFEKSRAHIAAGKCKRAGLLATQGIRGGANREVLKRIGEKGGIFWAESDRPWILDGATVHVSMVAFDNGEEKNRALDGKPVPTINANLTAAADTTAAHRRPVSAGISFQGPVKVGAFDVTDSIAREWLGSPNPHGRPNSDVLLPWLNGKDLTTRPRNFWIMDFGEMAQAAATLYDLPFRYVEATIKPERLRNADRQRRENWWRLGRSGADWKSAANGLSQTLYTPRVSKHRLFAWAVGTTLPDSAVVAFARSDDLFFGVLHSRFHEVWALAQGTQLREKESGFRYTPTTCFETFPLPAGVLDPPDPLPAMLGAIADAAKELNTLREAWLNPPEWTRTETLEFPGTVGGPWDRYIDPATVEDRGAFKVGTVRYPRTVARDEESAKRLKDRTLTKLYNERPAWLAACHKRLDSAVAAAYGWPTDLSDDEILERLLALNLEAAGG